MKTKYNLNFDQLSSKLKTEDENYSRLSRGIQIIYIILICFYIIIGSIEIFTEFNIYHLFALLCFIGAFVVFIIVFGNYHKWYKNVDYSEPTLIMLKKAAYRYKPFQRESLWVFLALILMDIGLCLNTAPNFDIWSIQIMFLSAMSIGLCIGLILYHIKYKPLRKNALNLIKEIEG